jgi:hypothetical protein
MAFVNNISIATPDVNCGDVMRIEVDCSFDTSAGGRTVSIRLPADAKCKFITSDGATLKITKPSTQRNVVMTFRPQIRCDRSGLTTLLLFAQASEPGSVSHEKQRTITVQC